MNSPIPVTAIFDIGKTNKKFFLYEGGYSIIYQKQMKLDEVQDDDGDPCENLQTLEKWVKETVDEVIQSDEYQLRMLNFSTYGASFVHLDENGEATTPLYNYLKPYPEELLNNFYEEYGGKKEISMQTASPPMGMLNSGLQLYWLKYEKPLKFREITYSLHFPQYLSYLFTGEVSAELTSIGCHTALWEFNKQKYHSWLEQEDCLNHLPKVEPVSKSYPCQWKGSSFQTGIGIHDSSAALAPYLIALQKPFMLVSTGTWSIVFNPFNESLLTYEELQRDCLCYMDVNGSQVKASRFFLGNEYMLQNEKLKNYFGVPDDREDMKLDYEFIQSLAGKKTSSQKLKLEVAYSSGPYPQDKPGSWDVSQFTDYKEAYHQLMLDLVAIQAESIRLAHGKNNIDKLIVTGGFSQNDFFVKLLASFFPEKNIYTSSLPNASALGAAMVVNNNEELQINKDVAKNLLALQKHIPAKDIDVQGYSWKESVYS